MKLIITEKPSVARDIAKVVGLTKKCNGFISGFVNGEYTCITWCIGHLVGICDPGEMSSSWKSWDIKKLPMLPTVWKLKALPNTRKQFKIVEKLMQDSKLKEIVCATDAGREGELIFRLVYELAKCKAKVRRLWISSLTNEAISEGLSSLKDSSHFDLLYKSAFSRAKADWLVGMNFSRLYSIKLGSSYSVGRVQTPTLKLIVDRELEIKQFVPRKYWLLKAKFSKPDHIGYYFGELNFDVNKLPNVLKRFRHAFEELSEKSDQKRSKTSSKLPCLGEVFAHYEHRLKVGDISVGRVSNRKKVEKPPLLYDLNELQRDGNKLFGFSAADTLKYAQSLYEKYKVITYPRTDSKHLTNDQKSKLPKILNAIKSNYQALIPAGIKADDMSSRYINNGKVTDHHAIIPTGKLANKLPLNESKVFDLICRRFLMAFMDDAVSNICNIATFVSYEGQIDKYLSRGVSVLNQGWKVLILNSSRKKPDSEDQIFPEWLSEGVEDLLGTPKKESKETSAPKRYTDASLLLAMETAGKLIDEKELGRVIKDCGIGTPATRANTIETLIKRNYIARRGKSFFALEKGIGLIRGVHNKLSSVRLTAEWEKALESVVSGEIEARQFDQRISDFVGSLLNQGADSNTKNLIDQPISSVKESASKNFLTNHPHNNPLKNKFDLKVEQREAIDHLIAGNNVFCVLPTGYGKSLIYQYAGLERGGRTIIISPLLSLMQDQIRSLKENGLKGGMLTSSTSFDDYTKIMNEFDEGHCSFLFVSPERASSLKFIERITRVKLSLIVFDEAHCISTWGVDFRPKYRDMNNLIAQAKEVPICLLSATVTEGVKLDIVNSLGVAIPIEITCIDLPRNNQILVENVDESERISRLCEFLEDDDNKPCVIYVPTRKLAEELATKVGMSGVSAYFHAGLSVEEKQHIQNCFLANQIDIVVATVAFGMGINKKNIRSVLHYVLPSSMEDYIQEIGRAGRDQKSSKSLVFYSVKDDSKLLKRLDYVIPELAKLDRFLTDKEYLNSSKTNYTSRAILSKLSSFGVLSRSSSREGYRLNTELVSDGAWRGAYTAYRGQKISMQKSMIEFATSKTCRKGLLSKYLSRVSRDISEDCGTCDICLAKNNSEIKLLHHKSQSDSEIRSPDYTRMLQKYLQNNSGVSSTLVFQRFAKPLGVSRKSFWTAISELERSKIVKVEEREKKVGSRTIKRRILRYLSDSIN